MSARDSLLPPQFDLALGFAEHAVAWAQRLGAAADSVEALRRAAHQLGVATAAGHVCLPLASIDSEGAVLPAAAATDDWGDPDAWGAWNDDEDAAALATLRARLLASGVVADSGALAAPGNAQPLVLDDGDRLYLRRHYDLEQRLAQALRQRAAARPAPLADDKVRALLATLFPAAAAQARPDWQRIAVALALQGRLTVISGGPGTGKTTTVAALLGALLGLQPGLRIALAAPTGKAAARMLEALRGRAARLPAAVRAGLPEQAHTVHRLLGVTSAAGRFRHHAGNPLPVDVLVVDEASMLDLALAARLVDALPPEARLVLLGDKDQLAAVEAGAVFAELSAARTLAAADVDRLAALTGCEAGAMAAALGGDGSGEDAAAQAVNPLAGSVVWLTDSHRFAADSGIGRLAADINAGRGEAALDWLQAGADPSAAWLEDRGAQPGPALWQAMEAGYADYLAALCAPELRGGRGETRTEARVAAAFAAFDRFRVLAAVHDGPRGLGALNAHLARWLRAALAHPLDRGAASPWYPGRPLIVLRNDYLLGLYNGDVGLCLPDADGTLAAWFPLQGGGFRPLPPQRLPAHDSAFALTVHKSQGSEFEEVLVVLPAQPSRVLGRELLYTGVTRAARRVTVAGAAAVFAAACASPTRRFSGLGARLREAAARK